MKSGEFLGPLLKTGLPLMKNLLKPLAKGVLIPSGLTAAVATDTGINQNLRIRDENTNKEIDDIMKIAIFFEESGLLIKGGL